MDTVRGKRYSVSHQTGQRAKVSVVGGHSQLKDGDTTFTLLNT